MSKKSRRRNKMIAAILGATALGAMSKPSQEKLAMGEIKKRY